MKMSCKSTIGRAAQFESVELLCSGALAAASDRSAPDERQRCNIRGHQRLPAVNGFWQHSAAGTRICITR